MLPQAILDHLWKWLFWLSLAEQVSSKQSYWGILAVHWTKKCSRCQSKDYGYFGNSKTKYRPTNFNAWRWATCLENWIFFCRFSLKLFWILLCCHFSRQGVFGQCFNFQCFFPFWELKFFCSLIFCLHLHWKLWLVNHFKGLSGFSPKNFWIWHLSRLKRLSHCHLYWFSK
jgi:hypothetical protein